MRYVIYVMVNQTCEVVFTLDFILSRDDVCQIDPVQKK